jgi:hypothetical protein
VEVIVVEETLAVEETEEDTSYTLK